MEFRILGPLEVLSDGQALDLGGQKQRALLALLLLEANRPVSRDRLIAALWEEEPTATAQKAIQVYVSQLRKLLGKERQLTRAPGYLLHAEADELDLTHFRRLQSEGKQRDALGIEPGKALRELHQAILRQDTALDVVPADEPATEAGRGVFVGREAEFAQLAAGLDDALAGRGRLFFLVGEPGIGKSRLADELTRRARQRGVQVRVGRCCEAGGDPAHWPWVQSVRSALR